MYEKKNHLCMINSIQGEVCYTATDNQRKPCMPFCWIDAETEREGFVNNISLRDKALLKCL